MTEAQEPQEPRTLNLLNLSVLAFFVGIATGLGAVGFRILISFIHNLVFSAKFSHDYDANVFTTISPWGPLIILGPVIGAVGVTYLVKNFAPEARGHGVPEVIDAIYYKAGVIRPAVAVVKSLASALTIGTGGSVGREGPIIQIGSALASAAGGVLSLAPWQRITLVAAGAGGGIAATFNTPLGAVLFAIELMMPEVSVRTFMPVAISTGMATFIGHRFFGFDSAFNLPEWAPVLHIATLTGLLAYAALGVVIGVAATAFIKGIYWAEDAFEQRIANPYLRHMAGMLVVGVILYVLMLGFGHYYVEGVGYATIQAILEGKLTGIGLLALLFGAKLVATSLTLGSGGSGGIFSPSLFLGATLGAAVGGIVTYLHPTPEFDVPTFAMVGMAAMVASATGAAMTATIMIFEMTRDYQIVLPMIVAVAISLGVRRLLSAENVYTLKLARRGRYIPKSLHAHMFLVRTAADVMDTNVVTLPASTTLAELSRGYDIRSGGSQKIVVAHGTRIAGLVYVDAVVQAVREADPSMTLDQLVLRNYVLAREGDVMFDVISRMSHRGVGNVLVVRGDRRVPRAESVLGVITKEQIADSVAESLTFRTERR